MKLHATIWKEAGEAYPWFYEVDYASPEAPKGDKSIDSYDYGSVESFELALECAASCFRQAALILT